ncbi:MAG: TrbC/VirB2 family protein [Candidatus Vogelbacteria bacterium]|nr:TrbC/VirB2 family protein [Candidatus Vogelbacteria bacterium]
MPRLLKQKINYRFALVFLLVFMVFNFLPLLLLAAEPATDRSSGLIPCGNGSTGPEDCKWADLVKLFNNVTDFIFNNIMIPLAVIAIVYAGIRVLLGQTKPEELIKAKGTLTNVAIGIFMALGAYAIVKTIISLLASGSGPIQEAIKQVFG